MRNSAEGGEEKGGGEEEVSVGVTGGAVKTRTHHQGCGGNNLGAENDTGSVPKTMQKREFVNAILHKCLDVFLKLFSDRR